MKQTSIIFLAIAVFLQSPLICMERQQLLPGNARPEDILNTPLSQIFVGASFQRQPPASQQLADVLKQRNLDADPLFSTEQRAANMTLIQSIGAHNGRAKLLGIASLILALNAAKDFTTLQVWGKILQYPLTDLVPPSHLMPLQPCYQICDLVGCCFGDCSFGPPCRTICTDQWYCTPNTPPSSINDLGNRSILSMSVNGLATALIGILACGFWIKEDAAEKKLGKLLKQLDEATPGITIPSATATSSPNPIQQVLDQQMAQDMAHEDQTEFDQRRKAFIDLMKAHGSDNAKSKLCFLLAALFSLNLAKDVALGHFYGVDTAYPLTPLIPPNHLVPLTPCKQVCWAAGCCNFFDCPITNETCKQECASQCVYETKTHNGFGYTSLGTSLVNLLGLFTSGLLGIRYSRKTNTIQQQIQQRFAELDRLAAASEDIE